MVVVVALREKRGPEGIINYVIIVFLDIVIVVKRVYVVIVGAFVIHCPRYVLSIVINFIAETNATNLSDDLLLAGGRWRR